MKLLLHSDTKRDVNRLIQQPTHGIIIEGRAGAGKRSLANHIVADLLGLEISKLDNYQYLTAIEPINSTISIEQIRSTQKFLKLKTIGQSKIRRAVIVEQAELMTIEAQNAFLKILEEPPTDTIIILLVSQKNKLLPTITSRAQHLLAKRLAKTELLSFFGEQGYTEDEIITAYYAANGQIGLMTSLLTEDQSNQQLEYIKQAKQLLAMNRFDRLQQVDSVIKQKEIIPGLVQALIITCQAALQATVSKDDLKQARRWQRCLQLSLNTEKQLSANPNSKLLLTNLLLNL